MIMAMTATPLAMLGCGFGTAEVGPVIQWHVFGMFAPSFFTGAPGCPLRSTQGDAGGLCAVDRPCGDRRDRAGVRAYVHFLSVLALLGIGWNFAFVGATALLTSSYRPSEQTKVQAFNEGVMFSLIAMGSLGAGWLYDRFGWVTLNLALLPALIVALVWTAAATDRRTALPVVT